MGNVLFSGEVCTREAAVEWMRRHGLTEASAQRVVNSLPEATLFDGPATRTNEPVTGQRPEGTLWNAFFADEGGWEPHNRKDGQAARKKKGADGRWQYQLVKETSKKARKGEEGDDLAAGADLNDPLERGMYADRLRDAGRVKEADEHLVEAVKLREKAAIHESFKHLKMYREFEDGIIEIPRLFKEAKKREPDLTHEKFQGHLEKMSKDRHVDLMRWEGGKNRQGGYGPLDAELALKGDKEDDKYYPYYYASLREKSNS